MRTDMPKLTVAFSQFRERAQREGEDRIIRRGPLESVRNVVSSWLTNPIEYRYSPDVLG